MDPSELDQARGERHPFLKSHPPVQNPARILIDAASWTHRHCACISIEYRNSYFWWRSEFTPIERRPPRCHTHILFVFIYACARVGPKKHTTRSRHPCRWMSRAHVTHARTLGHARTRSRRVPYTTRRTHKAVQVCEWCAIRARHGCTGACLRVCIHACAASATRTLHVLSMHRKKWILWRACRLHSHTWVPNNVRLVRT